MIKRLHLDIILNFLFKISSLAISFATIPMTIKFLGNEEYGIWALILSIIIWINNFDIGIGNSLKNKIAENIVLENREELKKNIASGYAGVIIIGILIFILSIIILNIVSIENIVKVKSIEKGEVKRIFEISIFFISLNFILGICNSIFTGFQKSYISSLNNFLYQLLNLIMILILIKYCKNEKLFILSIVYGIATILPNLISTIIFFLKNKSLIFKIKDISKIRIQNLFNVGLRIFIMQLCGIVIFFTDNWMISYFIGVSEVGEYSVVNKLFSIFIIFFGILLTPIWPAITQAYHIKNKEWIESTIKKMMKLYTMIFIITIFLIPFSKKIINYWTIGQIDPKLTLVILVGISTLLINFTSIYATIILGIGEVQNIMFLNIIQAILNILLSYYFVKKLNLGVNGIILATCVCLSINIFYYPYTLKKLLKKI